MSEDIETRVYTVQAEKKGMDRSAGWTRGFLLCVAVCVRPSQRCETRSRVHKRSVIYIWVHTYCPFSVHIYTRQMSGTVRRTDRSWSRKRESKVIYLNAYIDPPSFLFCWNISLPLFSLELAGGAALAVFISQPMSIAQRSSPSLPNGHNDRLLFVHSGY